MGFYGWEYGASSVTSLYESPAFVTTPSMAKKAEASGSPELLSNSVRRAE